MLTRTVQNIMRRFCQALPEERLLRGNDHDMSSVLDAERGTRVYTEKSTGARLTYGSSLAVLAHFVAALVSEWVYSIASGNSCAYCLGQYSRTTKSRLPKPTMSCLSRVANMYARWFFRGTLHYILLLDIHRHESPLQNGLPRSKLACC